jgi:hypothetical protein
MAQSNTATLTNYWRSMGYNGPPPTDRVELRENAVRGAERIIERIDSLAKINALRARGEDWSDAWEYHKKWFIEPLVSPPPPPRRPAPPQGSNGQPRGIRIVDNPAGSITMCSAYTEVERR